MFLVTAEERQLCGGISGAYLIAEMLVFMVVQWKDTEGEVARV